MATAAEQTHLEIPGDRCLINTGTEFLNLCKKPSFHAASGGTRVEQKHTYHVRYTQTWQEMLQSGRALTRTAQSGWTLAI